MTEPFARLRASDTDGAVALHRRVEMEVPFQRGDRGLGADFGKGRAGPLLRVVPDLFDGFFIELDPIYALNAKSRKLASRPRTLGVDQFKPTRK